MASKSPIRIIKRDERKQVEQLSEATKKEAAVDSTKVITSTISVWVREFKQRQAEPRRSFASLFKEQVPHFS